MPYDFRSREAVDCMLGFNTDMMKVGYSKGFQ